MGVSSSESHDLTAFYEMLSASFGVLSQNTGFYPSLDRIIETTLGPLNLGPRGGAFHQPKTPPPRTIPRCTKKPPGPGGRCVCGGGDHCGGGCGSWGILGGWEKKMVS